MDFDEQEERIPVEELLAAYIPHPVEETPQPVEEPQPEEEPEVCKPSKKRILLSAVAAVTAVALIIGAVFLLRPEEPEPAPVPDGGFYLLTKATEYHVDGSKGFSQITYTYDDRGFPLTITTDWGYAEEQVWNDDLGIYEAVFASFDGQADQVVEFVYNEKGDILYRLDTENTYDSDGALVASETDRKDQYHNHSYTYGADGKIESVDTYDVKVGGGTGELAQTATHHYDDNGRIIEVFNHSQRDSLTYLFDFRYDDAGRLTLSSKRPREGLYYYQYEYDDAGKLTRVLQNYGGHSEICYFDDCINEITYGYPADIMTEWEARFTYDSEGKLLSRCVYDQNERLIHRTDCEYQEGQLTAVTFRKNGKDTVYRYAAEGNGKDITLVQDINGNIIRQIRPDGSYIEYEYQRFDLSEEDIQRAKNVRYTITGLNPMGEVETYSAHMPTFEGGNACLADVPYPTTVLYETDILRNE